VRYASNSSVSFDCLEQKGRISDQDRGGGPSRYLVSKDVGVFFEKLGWYEVPVAEASKAAQAAPQVRRDHQVGWYPNERAFRRDLI